MGRPKGTQSKAPSKPRKLEQRIKVGNYHLDLVKHPENVYAVHLCIDSNKLYGYCRVIYLGLLTRPHFVSSVIPKVMLARYDVVTIFRSSGLFLVT